VAKEEERSRKGARENGGSARCRDRSKDRVPKGEKRGDCRARNKKGRGGSAENLEYARKKEGKEKGTWKGKKPQNTGKKKRSKYNEGHSRKRMKKESNPAPREEKKKIEQNVSTKRERMEVLKTGP